GKVRGWDEKYQAIGADWSSVVTAGQTALSLSDTMELFVREQLPEDLFMELMGRNKVVDPRFVDLFKSLTVRVPEPDDIFAAFTHGLVDENDATILLRRRGVVLDDWLPYLQARSEVLSPHEAIEYGLRRSADRDQLDGLLLRSGVSDASQRDSMLELYR